MSQNRNSPSPLGLSSLEFSSPLTPPAPVRSDDDKPRSSAACSPVRTHQETLSPITSEPLPFPSFLQAPLDHQTSSDTLSQPLVEKVLKTILNYPPCPEVIHLSHQCSGIHTPWKHLSPMAWRTQTSFFASTLEEYRIAEHSRITDTSEFHAFLSRPIVAFMCSLPDEYMFSSDQADEIALLYAMRKDTGDNANHGMMMVPSSGCIDREWSFCTSLNTCRCKEIYVRRTHCTDCYRFYSLGVTSAIASHSFALKACTDKTSSSVMKKNLRSSEVTHQLRWISNEELSLFSAYSAIEFEYSDVQQLRKLLGFNGFFGEFFSRAQSGTEWISGIVEGMWKQAKDGLKIVWDKSTDCLVWFKEQLLKISEYISGWFGGLFGRFSSFIVDQFSKMFDFLSLGKDILVKFTTDTFTKYWKTALCSIIIIIAVFLVGSKVINESVLLFSTSSTGNIHAHAQSVPPVAAALSLLALSYGIKTSSLPSLSMFFRNISSIAMGATATMGIAAGLMAILPNSMKICLIEKFGTPAAKASVEYDQWKATALTLLTASRTARIFTSPFFRQKLDDLISTSCPLLEKELDVQQKNDVRITLLKLVNLSANLVKLYDGKRTKPFPFAIHLAGRPGIGKTQAIQKILHALGFSPSDTYYRPPGTDHWDQFISAKAVVMDELFINTEQAQTTVVEYLNLCSSSQFIPAMASNDDPTVGMKGTPCSPDVVISANNATHYCPNIMDSTAYLRRRNVVAKFIEDIEWFKANNQELSGNIDVSKVSDEDVATFAWVKVQIYDSLQNKVLQTCSFTEFLEILIARNNQHRACNIKLGNEYSEGEDVEKLFERLYCKYIGLPTEPMTPEKVAADFLSPTPEGLEAQARPNREDVGRVHTEVYRQIVRLVSERVSYSAFESWWNHVAADKEAAIAMYRTKTPGQITREAAEFMDILNEFTPEMTFLRPLPELQQLARDLIRDRPDHISFQDIVNLNTGLSLNLDNPFEICQEVLCDIHTAGELPPFTPARDGPIVQNTAIKVPIPPPGTKPSLWVSSYLKSITTHDFSPPAFDETIQKWITSNNHIRFQVIFVTEQEHLDEAWKAYMAREPWTDKFFRLSNTALQRLSQVQSKTIVNTLFIVYIFLLVVLMFRMVSGMPTTFAYAQSARPTRNTTQKKRTVTLLSSAHAQSSSGLKTLHFTIQSGCDTTSVQAITIGKRFILTVGHVWDPSFDEYNVSIVEYPRIKFVLRRKEIAFVEDSDMVLFRISDPTFPDSRLIVNRFLHETELRNIKKATISADLGGNSRVLTAQSREPIPYHSTYSHIQLDYGFYYHTKTHIGDCGTPIVCIDNNNASKILGIHVAGGVMQSSTIGIATPVSIEVLNDMIALLDPAISAADIQAYSEGLVSTNITSTLSVNPSEIVYTPSKTKLKKSALAEFFPSTPKEPAVLTDHDTRTSANVYRNLVDRWAYKNTTNPEPSIIAAAADTMIAKLSISLDRTYENRRLTIEEAIGGIPGYLSSLKVKTSPGWPVVQIFKNDPKRGKTGCFNFVDSELVIEDWFREAVEHRLQEMDTGRVATKNRFLVFLKDELVSPEKVSEARTRAIYCNDVISLVAFRMVFGMTLARFNNSSKSTSFAIGINQYSKDMDGVHSYLAQNSNRFVAGDYKNFDLRYHKAFQLAAYRIFTTIAQSTPTHTSYLIEHETHNVLLQFREHLYQLDTIHTSGCFLTSVINCLVNELYMRYCFARLNPSLSFDSHIRLKVLGDDHIASVRKDCQFNPLQIASEMEKIGQIYTSDVKNQALTAEFRKFQDITFLGAHPREIRLTNTTYFIGAIKQDILFQTMSWTRTQDQDTLEKAKECCFMAASWDKKFFKDFVLKCQTGFSALGLDPPEIPSYLECQSVVAHRTATSGMDFFCESQGRTEVTTLSSVNDSVADVLQDRYSNPPRGLSEHHGECSYVDGITVWRTDFEWTPTFFEKIYTVMPDILKLGNPQNLQNMLFERFRYFTCDFEIDVQVAGSPFATGLLYAMILPFDLPAPSGTNWYPFFTHQRITPNGAYTVTLKQPFVWHRDVGSQTDTFFQLRFRAQSPLLYVSDPVPVKISIYTRMTNIRVFLPDFPSSRSRTIAYVEGLRPAAPTSATPEPEPKGMPDDIEAHAQGNVQSSETYNTYTFQNVTGNIPIGAMTNNTDQGASSTNDIEASIPMPLDNPPLMSGSVPTYVTYPSKSKVIGINTAMRAGMAPEELHRVNMNEFDSSVESYCSRPTLLTSFKWSSVHASGTKMVSLPINSLFGTVSGTLNKQIPSCLAPLNIARFWRSDFKLEVYVVRNVFHVGRLRATVAYGTSSFEPNDETVFKNAVFDFAENVNSHTLEIPYNAGTAFLEAKKANDFKHSTDMGLLTITVATPLACPPTVQGEIDVHLYLTAHNVRLREMSQVFPYSGYAWNDNYLPAVIRSNPPTREDIEAHSQSDVVATPYSATDSSDTTTQVATAPNETIADTVGDTHNLPPIPPCILNTGSHFEYEWSNFVEAARRSSPISFFWPGDPPYLSNKHNRVMVVADQFTSKTTFSFNVICPTGISHLFKIWKGSLQYRIICSTTTESTNRAPEIFFTPKTSGDAVTDASTPIVFSGMTPGLNDRNQVELSVLNPNNYGFCGPNEDLFAVTHKTGYIDINIPFESIYNYMPSLLYMNGRNPCLGYVTVILPFKDAKIREIVQVSQKVGDDFRCSTPWPVTNFNPFDTADYPRGTAGFRI